MERGKGGFAGVPVYLDLVSRAFGSFMDALTLDGGLWVMEGLFLDLRVALRGLLKRPGFTLVVVATLAVGIGANGAIFSLARDVLLKPFPYPDPERVVAVEGFQEGASGLRGNVSYPNMADLDRDASTMVGIATLNWWQPVLPADDGAVVLHGATVTANLFRVLGVEPGLGRFFSPEEEGPGRPAVVVLSHGLWLERFAGDPAVVGQMLELNGRVYEVIGVTSESFEDPWVLGRPGSAPRLWRTVSTPPSKWPRSGRSWRAVGRVGPEHSLEAAQAQVSSIFNGLEEAFPEDNAERGISLTPLREKVAGPARAALLALVGSVGILLLAACANLASLLLGRALDRQREFAVQRAMGAPAWRIVRRGALESLVMALLGGSLGVGISLFLCRGLEMLGSRFLPRPVSGSVDGGVLLFMVGITAGAAVLFGVAPALQAARVQAAAPGRDEGRGHTRGRRGQRLQRMLVVGEVTLTVILLVAAGLLLRSFQELGDVDLGFRTGNSLAMELHYSAWGPLEPEEAALQWNQVLKAVRAVPGVLEAGAMDYVPLSRSYSCDGVGRADRPRPKPGKERCAETRSTLPGALEALGIPVLRGRMISDDDGPDAPPTVVIDESMAEAFWPGEDPIGKPLYVHTRVHEVVGIVGDIRHFGPDGVRRPTVYIPTHQEGWNGPRRGLTLVLRGDGPSSDLTAPVRRAVLGVNPTIAFGDVVPFSALQRRHLAAPRFRAFLLGAFSLSALALAVLGIGGTMAHSVSRRIRELGVRMAVGAQPSTLLGLVVREGVTLTVAGLALGMVGAGLLGGMVDALLFEVRARDPLVFLWTALLVLAVGALSSYLPARRAAKVDPVVALSFE